MQQFRQTPLNFNPFSQIAVAEPLTAQLQLVQNPMAENEMDQFYQEMLIALDPEKQKQRYLELLQREVTALFRIDQVLVATLFADGTIDSYNPDVAALIAAIDGAPLSVSRISYILHAHYADHLSVEYFTKNQPTYDELRRGYLFLREDIEAGFEPDHTSLEELMCHWLHSYQQWMQDYLYFNLAQLYREQPAQLPGSYRNSPTLLDRVKAS